MAGRVAYGDENVPPSNIMRNPGVPSKQATGSSSSRQSGPEPPTIIEQHTRNSRGEKSVKQFARGKFLGKGGFAKVYEVKDTETHRKWACKIVPKCNLVKNRAKAKFSTEIKIHRGIKHDHVVLFHDVFEDKENYYMLMELCQNQTLLELVKRRKRLTEPETKYYMMQVIDACIHCHKTNVIHRDLKLGNLFLNNKMDIKIGDFGLAAQLAFDGEKKKTICGTPNYIAPEILDGKTGHSFEVDVWSVGVILYTLLIGKPPFETEDVKTTYKRIRANQYSFPDRAPISDSAKSLVVRILRSNPDHRPSLQAILDHDFFNMNDIPAYLPASALYEEPELASIPKQSRRFALDHATARPSTTREISDKPSSARHSTRGTTDLPVRRELGHEVLTAREAQAKRPHSSRLASDAVGERLEKMRTEVLGDKTNRQPSSADPELNGLTRRLKDFDAFSEPTKPDVRPEIKRSGSATHREMSDENSRPVSATTLRRESTAPPSTTSASAAPSAAALVAPVEPAATSRGDRAEMEKVDAKADVVVCEGRMARALSGEGLAVQSELGVADSHGPSDLPLPATWVTKWVDYSKKYGLGYLMQDGCSGVYFNDSSKMTLTPDDKRLEYVERLRGADGTKQDHRHMHSIANYPPELKKKVTLLLHFRNYLSDDKSKTPVAESDVASTCGAIYVKKWMRTRHAIIFRLSNNTFQVYFFDCTEVILWAESRWVTYRDKSGDRVTHDLATVSRKPDLAKRIKYVKDILAQLTARHVSPQPAQ